MIRTVLFDLDGTLADTAPDLAFALNSLLAEAGRPPLPLAQIRPVASHGSPALIQLGFGITHPHADYEPLRQRLLAIYLANIARETQLFAGVAELLQEIEQRGLNWGVVTNKPAFLTEPLLAALQLRQRAASVVSGDTLAQRKPHPAPLLLASREAGSEPAACLYLGDAQRDIEAGRRAGMASLIASWGYIAADDQPEQWGADGSLTTPAQLLPWLSDRKLG